MSMALTKRSQHLLVAHAFKQHNVASMLISILEPEDFSVNELQIIWKHFKNFWSIYKKIPSYQELIECMPDSVVMLVAELYSTSDLEEIPSIVEKAVNFKKAQHMKRFIEEANFTIHSDPDKAEYIIRNGLASLPLMDYKMEPMSESLPESILDYEEMVAGYPIGLKAFSSGLKGGVKAGELFFIAAPSGAGKSTILSSIAGTVALFTPVLYITLELSRDAVIRKISARIAGKRLSKLNETMATKSFVEVNKSIKQAFPVYVEYYSSGTLSVAQIGGMIEYLQHINNVKVGAVMIDYADLLRAPRNFNNKNDWEKVAQIWQEMVDLSKTHNVAIFTASQLSKEKGDIYSTDEIQHKDVSGSKEKINKCDIGLAFKPVGPREGNIQKGIWTWLKHRRGLLPDAFFGAIDYDTLQAIYIRPYTRQENVEVIGGDSVMENKKNKKSEKKKEFKSISQESEELL